jgi:ABC-type multidrug transport system fused ATPase/permease subunit
VTALRAWRRTYSTVLRASFAADRFGSLLLILLTPARQVVPALGALAVGGVVDAAATGAWSTALRVGLLAGAAVLVTLAAGILTVYLVHALEIKTGVLVERRMADILTGLPGIEHYENPEYLDKVRTTRQQADAVAEGLNAVVQMLAVVCQVAVVMVLLIRQDPLLALLPLFAFPSLLLSGAARKVDVRSRKEVAENDRLRHRLHGLAADVPVAREVRLFGLREELRTRRTGLAARVDTTLGRAQARSTAYRTLGQLIFAAGYLGAIAWVFHRALDGGPSAGDVAATVILAGQAQGFVSNLVARGQFMAYAHHGAQELEWLKDYGRRNRPARDTEPRPVPERITRQLGLNGVTFSYPGADRPVLNNLDLDLPAGSVVALVGENGAGKSTLVKLLLRLYEPTSGRITLDGLDLADTDHTEWRARTTGAFQDFCRPEFTAREAIALGDLAQLDDRAALLAAAQSAGADEVLDRLPQGPDTRLGASWPGGTDLSGGQWQRLALARGRLVRNPLLQVLDEPTAALDAEAEAALFDRYTEATEQARASGAVTLLVTHRFSTVRTADRILVLAGGRITETGTHQELLDADGLYAELYALQAAAYRT